MNGRCLAAFFTVMAVVLLVPVGVAGQTQTAAADSWAPSRTPWGEPDLQGTWDEHHHDAFGATRRSCGETGSDGRRPS